MRPPVQEPEPLPKKRAGDPHTSHNTAGTNANNNIKIPMEKNRTETLSKKINITDEFINFDFSKTHISEAELAHFRSELETRGLVGETERMFSGERINFTENRSVLHTVLRHEDVIKNISKGAQKAPLEGEKQVVYTELLKIKKLCEELHGGCLKGATGKKIGAVVNIGIGGSDLGPGWYVRHWHAIRCLE